MKPAPITVIIPAYNAEATITAALDSVCEQTLPPEHIIVVDDLSGDDTCRVVERYIEKYADNTIPRIILLQQEQNGGPATARNRGAQEAETEWIAFLDGDDQWLPHKIERQLKAVSDTPAVMICGETLPLIDNRAAPSAELSPTPQFTELQLESFLYANPVATSTVLLKRDAFLQAGGFDEQFRGPEDYDLWMRIAASGKIIKLKEALSLYRHVPGSLSMDDRTFLPQVISVLEKAFATDGVLHSYVSRRKRAYAEKYSSASWMAFNRQARGTALRLLLKSFVTYPRKIHPEEHDPLLRLKLLLRYTTGPFPPQHTSTTSALASCPPPRVAHLVISLKHGGLEQCALQWCKHRNRIHPNSTIIICLDEAGPLAKHLPPETCYTLNAERSRFPWDRKAVRKLKQIISELNVDIIHSHNTAARQYAALASSSDCRHLYTDHSSNLYLRGLINKMRMALMKRKTNVRIAVSREAADKLAKAENAPSESIRIIRNGVVIAENSTPTNSIADIRRELGLKELGIVIVFVGRISHEKGVDRLINAFSKISHPAQLLIIGDGPLRSELEGLAESLGLTDRIHFIGERNNARSLLHAMDLFVLPSRSEGLPLALLEAMAEKIPVAATNVGDCAEVLDNGACGIILDSDESRWPSTLDETIAAINEDRLRAKVESAFNRVKQNYSLDATIACYEEIYNELNAG